MEQPVSARSGYQMKASIPRSKLDYRTLQTASKPVALSIPHHAIIHASFAAWLLTGVIKRVIILLVTAFVTEKGCGTIDANYQGIAPGAQFITSRAGRSFWPLDACYLQNGKRPSSSAVHPPSGLPGASSYPRNRNRCKTSQCRSGRSEEEEARLTSKAALFLAVSRGFRGGYAECIGSSPYGVKL